MFAANVVALSILITWVFIHTEGSVFLAILMHLLFNLTANPHHLVAVTAVNATVATLVIAGGGLSTQRPQIGRALGSQTGMYATIAALIMLLVLSAAVESRPGARSPAWQSLGNTRYDLCGTRDFRLLHAFDFAQTQRRPDDVEGVVV